MKQLTDFLITWCRVHDFQIDVMNMEETDEIDFINVNMKTKRVFFGALSIDLDE